MANREPSNPPGLAGFEYVRPIGSGGFADVFLYRQELPAREVAVKVLLENLGPAAVAAFTSEANLMARLSTHPYIVTIHGAGVAPDGRPYLVMEYCSRPSLAERYKARPLSVDDALRTGIRLASAVETAHRAGILHRDIKPGNVLTNDYGWPALTDFGIAAAADAAPVGAAGEGGDPEGTSGGVTGSVGLSVPWSPPEMFLDVPEHDARSDVFSLAATLHTVLAGRTPFEVPGGPNSAADLMARIERGRLTPLERPDVPGSLAAILRRGMAPRREDRYPSALEFARALQRVELELALAPTGLEIPDTTAPRATTAIADDDAPETRVRGIPSVSPEAPATPAPVPAPAPRPDPVRRSPAATRARLVGILVATLSVLAIGVVALVVVLSGAPIDRPETEPTTGSTGGSAIVGGAVPTAVDGVAEVSSDGTAVVFSWTNPDPQDGDVYYWARSETPDDRQAVRDTTVTVTGIVPGSRVCIDVETGRAGRTSEPLRICTS